MMVKKTVLLIVILCLCSCAKKDPASSQQPPAQPTETACCPSMEKGTCPHAEAMEAAVDAEEVEAVVEEAKTVQPLDRESAPDLPPDVVRRKIGRKTPPVPAEQTE